VAGYWLTICHPLTDYRSPSERLSDLDNSNKFVRWLLGVVLCDSLQFDEHVRYVYVVLYVYVTLCYRPVVRECTSALSVRVPGCQKLQMTA